MEIVKSKKPNLREILNNEIDKALANGTGFTINEKGESQAQRSSGYAVGISDDILTAFNRRELIEDRIDYLVSEGNYNLISIRHSEKSVGLWILDGKVYFDRGIIEEDVDKAMKAAIFFNQKAIYSFSEEREIFISNENV